ncbi:unnamed protein product [Rhizoctonia solani]|uniref:5'-nucleotidase n=1 Tax=Rhizoctonia solani TaxID=456999 RepID=A0A8H3CVB4_9AGAM|nr:unnamed protein product [Rhizoctonia solani]
MTSVSLPVIHFNDVYNMTRRKGKGHKTMPIIDQGGLTSDNFDHVVQFSEKIRQIRSHWDRDDRRVPQGLLLFSGDLFSPSIHLMNELAPDACVPGNHEFDFGRQRFDQLIEFCNFTWILSNLKEYPVDPVTKQPIFTGEGNILQGLREYLIIERCGLRIGLIGMMSDNALGKTNTKAKSNLKSINMGIRAMELAAQLRKPKEESGEGCDLIFALTHAEHSEDVELGKHTGAYPAGCKTLLRSGETLPDEKFLNGEKNLEDIPGVDVIFGGHNHDYFLGKGVKLVDQTGPKPSPEPSYEFENDEDLLIVKTGQDFDDLSEVVIKVEDRPNGKERKKVVTSVEVIRHHMTPLTEVLPQVNSPMEDVLRRQFMNEVLGGLNAAVARTENSFPTVVGNWIADAMLRWYGHLAEKHKLEDVPLVFMMTGGSIRGGITLGPGKVLAREIIQLLPFDTPLTSLLLKGEYLKAALDAGLKNSDRGEDGKLKSSSRFPVVSGMRVEWDSRKLPGDRVQKISLVDDEGNLTSEIDPSKTYRVLTNTYLADGNDGFEIFKKGQREQSYEELPMFQVLRNYINDLTTIGVYEALLGFAFKYAFGKERTPEMEALMTKIQGLEPLLKDDEWENASVIAKHAATWLLGPAGYLPELDIKTEVDGRMKDLWNEL